MDSKVRAVPPATSLVWQCLKPLSSYLLLLGLGWLLHTLLSPAWLWDDVSPMRLVAVFMAAPLYCYATFHTPRIVRVFQSVQIRKDEPQQLLTDGYYAQVRHPFYAMNILSIFSLMVALGSVYSLGIGFIAGALFYYNGFYDEQRWLYPRFGEDYKAYAQRVPARYFTPLTGGYLTILIVTGIAGIIL